MGLSSMPSVAEAFFPVVLVANALSPFAILRDGLQRMLRRETDDDDDVNASYNYYAEEHDHHQLPDASKDQQNEDRRNGVRLRRFRSMGSDGGGCCCCCVCLHGFEGEEEVTQVISCRHFFHRGCLDGWLDRMHTTCPLCRSTVEM